jgi:XRE family transcriptional regulator, fatty acid utilization regulator
LYLNSTINETELIFILIREIAFSVLGYSERLLSSGESKIDSFEQLFNSYKAGYFSNALVLPKDSLLREMKLFFAQPTIKPDTLQKMARNLGGNRESLFQRLCHLLPTFFEMDRLFLVKFEYNSVTGKYALIRKPHLSQLHNPYRYQQHQHFCRFELAYQLLCNNHQQPVLPLIDGIQRSYFNETGEEYLCFATAFQLDADPTCSRCQIFGIGLNDKTRQQMHFLSDSAINQQTVGTTCEMCHYADCPVRVAAPLPNEPIKDEDIQSAMNAIVNDCHKS